MCEFVLAFENLRFVSQSIFHDLGSGSGSVYVSDMLGIVRGEESLTTRMSQKSTSQYGVFTRT